MAAQIGTYFFGRHYRAWGIWQHETSNTASHVKDVYSYEEAVKEVYRLNGWGEPKKIYKRY